MTKEGTFEEGLRRLLEMVDTCDQEILMAYEKRRRAATELQKWLEQKLKEASDGEVSSNNS